MTTNANVAGDSILSLDDPAFQNSNILKALQAVEHFQKQAFAHRLIPLFRLSNETFNFDRQQGDLVDVPVFWGEQRESQRPPYWLNKLSIAGIERSMGFTKQLWRVDMSFAAWKLDNFDNQALMLAAITAENLIDFYDQHFYLEDDTDDSISVNMTVLNAPNEIITVEETMVNSERSRTVSVNFGLLFGLWSSRVDRLAGR